VLTVDTLVVVQGIVKVRTGEAEGQVVAGIPQVWASRVVALKDCTRYFRAVVLRFASGGLDDVALLRLKELFESHSGDTRVRVEMAAGSSPARGMWLSEFRVRPDNELLTALREIVGPDRVRLVGELPCGAQNGSRRNRGSPTGNGPG
jgi:hypothetical protein